MTVRRREARRRHRRRRPARADRARRHPGRRRRAAGRAAARRRPTGAPTSSCSPSWRSPRSSPAGGTRTATRRSTPGTRPRCPGPTRSRCGTRPCASASASASASPSGRPTATASTPSVLVGPDGARGRAATARSTCPATTSTSRGARSSTSRSATSSGATWASRSSTAFGGKVGMLICNDRRWPEAYRVLGLQGVELICIGYNTPVHNPPAPEHDRFGDFHNHLVMQAGAYQNGTFVVGVAKAGDEEGIDAHRRLVRHPPVGHDRRRVHDARRRGGGRRLRPRRHRVVQDDACSTSPATASPTSTAPSPTRADRPTDAFPPRIWSLERPDPRRKSQVGWGGRPTIVSKLAGSVTPSVASSRTVAVDGIGSGVAVLVDDRHEAGERRPRRSRRRRCRRRRRARIAAPAASRRRSATKASNAGDDRGQGEHRREAAVEPGHDRPVRAGHLDEVAGLDRGGHAGRGVGLDADAASVRRPARAPPAGSPAAASAPTPSAPTPRRGTTTRASTAPPRRSPSAVPELRGVDLGEDRRVALDDPARRVLVARATTCRR